MWTEKHSLGEREKHCCIKKKKHWIQATIPFQVFGHSLFLLGLKELPPLTPTDLSKIFFLHKVCTKCHSMRKVWRLFFSRPFGRFFHCRESHVEEGEIFFFPFIFGGKLRDFWFIQALSREKTVLMGKPENVSSKIFILGNTLWLACFWEIHTKFCIA